MKKTIIIIFVAAVLLGGGWLIFKPASEKPTPTSQCEIKEITFYYLDGCEWCNKVKSEGTLTKIEELGVKITKINAAVGPVRHKFTGVPTFIIDEKVYEGYKTFEEIKELLKCSLKEVPQPSPVPSSPFLPTGINFIGEKGENLTLENGEIRLASSIFNDNKAYFYNVKMPLGKIIYFFVVKDKNGIYRAAANACAVCFKTYKGFRQEGNEIVCNNCGNRYPIEKIATEKGGCNPGPINPNLEVKDGQIIIKQADIEQVSDLF